MAFIPVPNVALVEIVQLCQSQRVENTLYFQKSTGGWTESTMLDLGDRILTWWDLLMAPITGGGSHIAEIDVTDLSAEDAPGVTVVPGAGQGLGTNIGEMLPNNNTLCVSFRTGGRGRSARGRNYTCGVTVVFTNGNLAEPGYVSQVRGAYTGLLEVASDTSSEWVVVSRFHNKAPRPTGVTRPVLAVVVTDDFMDSQRRRLAGRGT